MAQPGQFDNPGESGFQPPRFQPIKPSDVAAVKKSYGITQAKFAKGTTDKSIYSFSTSAVINWWKKMKADEAAAAAAGTAGSGASAPSGGGGGGGGGTGSFAVLPPTGVVQPVNTQTKAREGGPAPAPARVAPRPVPYITPYVTRKVGGVQR